MANPIDPNEVMMTGENSFIRLSPDGGSTITSRLSHWRVRWCPAGAGHALFMKSELTGGDTRIYSDNIAVARWLQTNIETFLFAEFADPSLPVTAAIFDRTGDPRSTTMELIESDDDIIRMCWYDCIDAFVIHAPPGSGDRPIGVFTTFFPARSAQLSMNGRVASGQPWAEMRGDRQSSSCVLAWSETWVKPK
jgi:hypothetical protein